MIKAEINGKTCMKNRDKRWRTNPDLWEKLKTLAREMRHEPTEAEKQLWKYLRKHQMKGLGFRREHSIGQFIVDFYCKQANLVIEVDGPIHQYQTTEDMIRQEYLESLKLKVLRFSNDTILNNVNEALKQIEIYLTSSI